MIFEEIILLLIYKEFYSAAIRNDDDTCYNMEESLARHKNPCIT